MIRKEVSDPSLLKCKRTNVNNFKINERTLFNEMVKTLPGKFGIEFLFKRRDAKILKPVVSLESAKFTPTKYMLKIINTEDYKCVPLTLNISPRQ